MTSIKKVLSLPSGEIKSVPAQAAGRLCIFTRDFPTGMLTVEIKWCPNLIIFDDYILLEASPPLPGASQTFLCRELTGALLEPNICASHSSVSLLHETLNPDNQPKHIQAFILKIRTAKTRRVLTVHKGWNWILWTCSTNAAGKNNTHLRSGEIQGHSWYNEALWFSSALNNRGNRTFGCSNTGLSFAVCTSTMMRLWSQYTDVKRLSLTDCLANWVLTAGQLIRSNSSPHNDPLMCCRLVFRQCSRMPW